MSSYRTKPVIGACATALALWATSGGSAFAQTVGPDAAGEAADQAAAPDDIVVTAQKRSESALTVPVSVSAVSADSLVRENLARLGDFATRVPGLNVAGARLSDVSIRGVSGNNGTSPTTAFTIDDVPFGPTSWAGVGNFPDLDPSDIQRIEVLRGPQGTLYGAASLGGLIKYVTRPADPNDWAGRVEAGLSAATGGDLGYVVRGSVNVPVVSDVLGIRASAFRRHDPNIVDMFGSPGTAKAGQLIDENAGSTTVEGFRGALFLRPFDGLTINVSHLQQTTNTQNVDFQTPVDPYPTTFTPKFGYFGTDATASLGKVKVALTQLRAELDLGGATLTSVSGWGRLRNVTNSDVSRTLGFVYTGVAGQFPAVFPTAPAGSLVRIDNAVLTTKFSQEVRLASAGDTRLQWLIGGFYTVEHSSIDQEIYGADPSGARIGSIYINSTPSLYREYAVFADATYKFTDRFDVQVGIRYSHNKQTYQTQNTVNPAAVPIFGASTLPTPISSEDDSVTWLVSPRFRINDDVMAFARVATGYRPGGPNSSPSVPQKTFGPDRVINYELGLKGRFLDRKLTVDAALFIIDWRDIQLQSTTFTGFPYFSNGGKARSRGFEMALQYSPGGGWEFTGNLTVNDAKLHDALPVVPGAVYLLGGPDTPLPFAAAFSSNLGFDKYFELGNGITASIGMNYNHVGRRSAGIRSSGAPLARQGLVYLPGYDVIDLRAGIGNGKWNLSAFMRNATNAKGVVSMNDNGGQRAATTAVFIQPRTTGFTVSYTF